MKLGRIEHIDLVVSDVQRSTKFYQKLGMKVIGTLEKGDTVFLGYGDETSPVIELHQRQPGRDLGLDHLAFYVDDVEGAYEETSNAGVDFHLKPQYGTESGRTIANFRDPDGIQIQLAHKTTRGDYEDFI